MSDDHWSIYLSEIDEQPASVLFDGRWLVADLPAEASHLYSVTLVMEDPDEHGLGADSEDERLGPVEDAVWTAFAAAGGIPVGRVRSGGRWIIYGQGPADLPWDEIVATHAAEVEHSKTTEEDPDGMFVHTQLLPDREEQLYAQDLHLIMQLEAFGDDLSKPRQVEHYTYFAVEADRDAFAKAAEKLGYEVSEGAWMPEDEAEIAPPEPFSAAVAQAQVVSQPQVHEHTLAVHDLAMSHRGTYDGWECEVLAPLPEA